MELHNRHHNLGLPQWVSGKESARNTGNTGDVGLIPGSGRKRRKWQPTPVFLPGEVHAQRNLEGQVHEVTESRT